MDIISHFFEIINKNKKILIAIPNNPLGDVFFSALALRKLLKSSYPEKQIKILCSDLGNFQNSKFSEEIKNADGLSKKWEFSLDIENNKAHSLKYEKSEKQLKIIIFPENSAENYKNYSFSPKLDADAIISIGIPQKNQLLNSLGEQCIKGVPLINIDNNPENKKFGDLFIVKENISIAQILCLMLNDQIVNKKFDADCLSMLYSAIISATEHFKDPSKTNSKLLKAAAVLLEKGAELKKAFFNLSPQPRISDNGLEHFLG